MCGRYYIYDETMEEAERLFEDLTSGIPKAGAGDITPGMNAPAVLSRDGGLSGGLLKWGFKGFEPGKLIINSRAESIKEKPLFRESMAERRCVLPAAGFYEWDRTRQKTVLEVPGRSIIFLAGIWTPETDGARFSIVTREANASMLPVHDRMPLILDGGTAADWIKDPSAADEILHMTLPELLIKRDYEQLSLF